MMINHNLSSLYVEPPPREVPAGNNIENLGESSGSSQRPPPPYTPPTPKINPSLLLNPGGSSSRTKDNKKAIISNSQFIVKINGKEISTSLITGITLGYSFNNIIPWGTLKLSDKEGSILGKFQIAIGTLVEIGVRNLTKNNPGSIYNFSDFVVTGIKGDSQYNKGRVGGDIVYSLAYPWALYRDWSNHAYPKMLISEIMKKVVKESNRGYQIDIGTVVETDEQDKKIRYKYGMGDDDFIANILTPFAACEKSPCFPFVGEDGKFNLLNFKEAYNKNEPLVCLIPDIMSSIEIDEYLKENAPSVVDKLSFDDIEVLVGGKDIRSFIETLRPRVYIDNFLQQRTITGLTKLSTFADESNKYFPILKTTMGELHQTEGRYLINMAYDDASALNIQASSNLIKFFEITIQCDFSPKVTTGGTVFLAIPFETTENGKTARKYHWMDGKWLVNDVVHYSLGDNLQAKMVLHLVRPSFVVANKSTLSIENINLLYKAI